MDGWLAEEEEAIELSFPFVPSSQREVDGKRVHVSYQLAVTLPPAAQVFVRISSLRLVTTDDDDGGVPLLYGFHIFHGQLLR